MSQAEGRLRNFDGPERRSRIRFPIELGARYVVIGRAKAEGTGWTVNISSQGVLITSREPVPSDTSIRVVIEWPILLGDISPLALHIGGKVVRSDSGLIAVRFFTHELRIRPKPPGQVPPRRTLLEVLGVPAVIKGRR
jgi:PilZ domain